MKKVLVTGGSGALGRLVVTRLAGSGHDVRVLSRGRSGAAPAEASGTTAVIGDLRSGEGLAEALEDVEAVVHCASDPRDARAVDVAGTGRLTAAARRAGHDPHLVYVSIVGVDVIPWGYYRAKRDAERVVAASGLPWTVQRATQLHSFVAWMLGRLAEPPVMVLPRGFRFQPIATADVAERLVSHVEAGPSGRADDLGGPRVLDATYLAGTWLRATGRRRPVLPVPAPGRVAAAFRSGANLCPDHAEGTGTWEEFLETDCRHHQG